MSEPMTSNDIEDVLSSIRRLVSEDLRPIARAAAAAPVVVETNDKLILTPALRVVEAAVRTDAPAPRLTLTYPRTVEIADFEDDSVANDLIEPAEMEKVFATLGTPHEAEALPSQDPDPAATDLAFYADPQDDLTEAPMYDGVSLALDQESEPVPAWAQTGFDSEEIAEADAPPVAESVGDADWVDAAEASVIASLADQPAEPPQQAFVQDAPEADDAFLFNEDVLRELVRDILREELAGSMGERITRNIRKLVRSEIARGLATQDLA